MDRRAKRLHDPIDKECDKSVQEDYASIDLRIGKRSVPEDFRIHRQAGREKQEVKNYPEEGNGNITDQDSHGPGFRIGEIGDSNGWDECCHGSDQ